MKGIFELIAVYFILAGVGTAYSNRHKTKEVRRGRWVKFVVHLFIVYGLIGIMEYATNYFHWVALAIISVGAWELIKVRREGIATGQYAGPVFYILSLLLYAFIGFGFYKMATVPDKDFILLFFLLVFTFDGFSQVSGQIFGKRKLFPRISPNKTVEGLLGGLLMVLLTIIPVTMPRYHDSFGAIARGLSIAIPASLLLVSAALAGDWLASFYKRRHGVKDFSALIPGHGGFLDRFDSWLVVGALVYWVTYVLECLHL